MFWILQAMAQEKDQLEIETTELHRLLSEEKARNDNPGKSFANCIYK